jgi:SAM-dependent methyltransferase
MGKRIKPSPKYWSSPASLKFYSVSRSRIDDLYPSEKIFLPRLLKKGFKVLDAGCAAGGFYSIMKGIQPDIIYYGCDFSAELIKKAKQTYNGVKFIVADLIALPFKENYFDLVNCAGTCHMIPDYLAAIAQMYRVSRRFLLFDVRLTDKVIDFDTSDGYQRLCFDNNFWDGESVAPYIVLNAKEFLQKLLYKLSPKPKAIYATGYIRPPAATVEIPLKEICMAVFMIEKPDRQLSRATELCLDIPYDYMNEDVFKGEERFQSCRLNDILMQKIKL